MSALATDALHDALQAARAAVQVAGGPTPQVGVVLGSGLGAFAEQIVDGVRVPYAAIPHMPRSGVLGHRGELVLGHVQGVACAVMSGRAHMYEGHSAVAATFGTRLLATLGARSIVLTNAAGGIRADFRPGTIMALSDHLNLTGDSPLRGPNDARLGERFFDMGAAYGAAERAACRAVAARLGITLEEGVYAGVLGPSYETPAEIRMLRALGADAVGMSTVSEAIVARHMGARVLGLSVITNLAAGLGSAPLSHAEVTATARRTEADVCALLAATVAALPGCLAS